MITAAQLRAATVTLHAEAPVYILLPDGTVKQVSDAWVLTHDGERILVIQ